MSNSSQWGRLRGSVVFVHTTPSSPTTSQETSAVAATLRLSDIASEAVLLAGGGAAILMQLANPAVARGVAHHSDFVNRPLDRLFGTLDYVYAVAFGDDAMLASVVRSVNRAHGPVHDRATAPGYNAFDPQLQLWVASTLYYAALQVQERVIGPIDERTAEAIYLDYAALGTHLQMPESAWPADRAKFNEYWNASLDELEATDESRTVVHSLFHPTSIPIVARLAMPLIRLLSTGLLPPQVRTLHGLTWGNRQQARFDRILRITRFIYPKLPLRLRHLPRDRSLARVRRKLEQHPAKPTNDVGSDAGRQADQRRSRAL